MKKTLSAFLFLIFALAPHVAVAQQTALAIVVQSCGTAPYTYVKGQRQPVVQDVNGNVCTTAAVTASISGFQTTSYGTPISATTGGATGSIPTNAGEFVAQNVGAYGAFCETGASVTTAGQYLSPNGGWWAFAVTSETQITCEGVGSTTTVNLYGGTGLPTGTGGGGGSGGGGAITAASGAYAAGSIASGAMVDLGSQADPVCGSSTGSCSLIALLKYLNNAAVSAVPWLATTAWSTNSYSNGTTNPGAADLHGAPFVDVGAINGVALLAGTGAQGTGSPRVTVATDQATNAGAALVKGGVGVVNGGSFYETVAASQTAQVLQSSTGATGDYLSHCTVLPTSTSPGVVTILDNSTAIYSFPGGASSLSNLVPWTIPVGAVSVSGAWKVTTGASLSVVCVGKFS